MKKLILHLSFLLLSAFVYCQLNWSFTTAYYTFNTSYGYVRLGPASAPYGPIETDRDRFLFNKDIITSTGGYSTPNSTTNLVLKTNLSTPRLTILASNGNVGITTSNPTEKLHVGGNILSTGFVRANGGVQVPDNTVLTIGNTAVNDGYLRIFSSASSFHTSINFNRSLYFRRIQNGTQNLGTLLGLQSDGTITMGVWERYDGTNVDTEGNRLMVNGGILCESIKVIEDVPDADYVFEDDYKLMTLEQVSSFVKNNKHLPNIPSAAEFQECGYKVSEMDEMLLRKVEELTLYMIQMKEELEVLKAENIKLKEKNNE